MISFAKRSRRLNYIIFATALWVCSGPAMASETFPGCIGDKMQKNCTRATLKNIEDFAAIEGSKHCSYWEVYGCRYVGYEMIKSQSLSNVWYISANIEYCNKSTPFNCWIEGVRVSFMAGASEGILFDGQKQILDSNASEDGMNFSCKQYFGLAKFKPNEIGFRNDGVICVEDIFPEDEQEKSCPDEDKFGNPIYPTTGNKRILLNIGIEDLSIIYQSNDRFETDAKLSFTTRARDTLGPLWKPSWVSQSPGVTYPLPSDQQSYRTWTGGDQIRDFKGPKAGRMFASGSSSFAVDDTSVGATVSNTRVFHEFGAIDTFERASESYQIEADKFLFVYFQRIDTQRDARGQKRIYKYSTPQDAKTVPHLPLEHLLSAIEAVGSESIYFGYEKSGEFSARLVWVRQGGREVHFEYKDDGHLRKVIWPDTTYREFLYENNDLPWAITGEVHEDGRRFSTYVYSTSGAAIETYTGDRQNRFAADLSPALQYTKSINADGKTILKRSWSASTGTLSTPLGAGATLGIQSVNGANRLVSRSQPAGSGCTAANAETGYDARGNITSAKDFAGRRSCMAYDPVRPLETMRLEGLTAACPDNLATYTILDTLDADKPQRLTHTQWHPMWAKPVRVAEPKRITTTVYNGQPDPLNGGAVANCVPAGAVLPVGETLGSTTPLAVVCKRYEQATNDATGQLGFAAAETGRRSWSYTYNARGQVTKATDPVGQVTDYTYFEADDFTGSAKSELGETLGQHVGDLNTVSVTVNAVKQTTTHTHYNQWGQVLRSVLPNGNVEERAYNARGALRLVRTRPVAASTDSLLTEYTYHPTGLLDKLIQPDGRWLKHHYDESRRLSKVEDHLGNMVEYSLDGAGNRLQEKHLDAQGVRQKLIVRTYDALSRMQSETLVP